jgi:hypothetical protein
MAKGSKRVLAAAVILIWSVAVAQAEPSPETGVRGAASNSASDSRIALGLPPATQEILDQTMREHLEALQSIVAALAREDYGSAAALAHEELGFPKHHRVMQREQGAPFPPRYQELAMAHHQKAEDLAEAIRTKESTRIWTQLDLTMKACVSCHQTYKR